MSLIEEAAKSKISRMIYTNFEDAITAKHGIVLENWPLKEFCNPSAIKSRNEVVVLLRSWESGTTRFRRMDTREWEAWSETRFQQEQAPASTSGTGDDGMADNDTADTADNDTANNDSNSEGLNLADSDRLPDASPDTQPSHQPDLEPSIPTTEQGSENDTSTAPVALPLTSTTSPTAAPPTVSAGHKRPATSGPSGSRAKKRPALSSTTNFINSTAVTNASGASIFITKKKRKERSDKGVKRGKKASKSASGGAENS